MLRLGRGTTCDITYSGKALSFETAPNCTVTMWGGNTESVSAFSCVFQGVIPYGAQMLVAISAVAEMGVKISAFQIMQYLFYPYLLLVSVVVSIFFVRKSK